jgi:hypothetical protein
MVPKAGVAGAMLLVATAAMPAVADEAKTPIKASIVLDMVNRPVDSRQIAFDESIKREVPSARGPVMEVLPDGTVRYGDVSVTVKNPCPPGTAHYEAPPLPGRRVYR